MSGVCSSGSARSTRLVRLTRFDGLQFQYQQSRYDEDFNNIRYPTHGSFKFGTRAQGCAIVHLSAYTFPGNVWRAR
jgi:hypothetical protein